MEPILKKFGYMFTSLILIIVSIIVLNDVDIVEGGFHKSRIVGTHIFCKDKWRSCMRKVRFQSQESCNTLINRKFMCSDTFTKDKDLIAAEKR